MKPSKVDHSLGSDIRFLVKMIVRIGHLQSLATIGLTFWKDVHRFDPSTIDDHRLAGRSGWMRWVKPYEGEIMTFCWGLLVWTMLDISGSLINKSRWIESISTNLNLTFDHPIVPIVWLDFGTVIGTIFWGKSSSMPVWSPSLFFLVRYLGLQPNSKVVRLGGILGAFSVSGAVHEFGFWSAGPIDPTFRSFRFFFFQGVGVCLEQGFRTLTGRRVDGLIGKIWTFSWLIFFGKPMVRVAMKTLSLEPDKLFEKIDEIGLLGLILRPLSLFKLFEALWTFLTHPTLLSWSTTSIPLHWFFFLSLCFFLVFSFLWALVPIPIFGFVYIPHPTFRSFFVSMSFLDQFAPIHRLPSSLFSRWLYSPVKPSSPCLILLSV